MINRISQGSRFEQEIGYARVVIAGDWAHVSGTTGYNYADMSISTDILEQTRQCLANIDWALREAGYQFSDVVRVQYILPDASEFEECWPVLREAFADHPPAATMIEAGLADPAMKIEILATAWRAK